MDHRSPTVYRSRSWTNRRRALIALGVAALVLLGYLIGTWGDSPAVTPAAAVSPPAVASASPPPSDSPSPSPSPSPYEVLQAESATELAGIQKEGTQDEGGGENVGWITRADFLRFDNYDFGEVPATKVRIRVSSEASVTGLLEIRLDSRDSPPVGELSVSSTGGWQNWRTRTTALQPVTGVHTVFVTFSAADDSEFVNLNWFQFEH
ncbi:carbohydrate-binding protein [Actinoplanes sp. GCM10030250]|uniref:carbohydrate-binding protein n=1 Tax=Actinoplanes sp. GCM10030250 TaxID=3273376 RepID=UPI0036215F65